MVDVATTPAVLILWYTFAVLVVPETVVSDTHPIDVPTTVEAVGATKVVVSGVPSVSAACQITNVSELVVVAVPRVIALEVGAETTVNIPAVRADTATSAMRCLIVFIDICILSLVRLRIS